MSDLNSRQQKFCHEYAKGKSGAQAYLDAGYNPKNRTNASKYAHQLLQKPEVKAEWNRIRKIREQRTSARRNTAIDEAISFIIDNMAKARSIVEDIEKGKELTKDERMLFSAMMNNISTLSREEINIVQQVNNIQGRNDTDIEEQAEKIAEIMGDREDSEGS